MTRHPLTGQVVGLLGVVAITACGVTSSESSSSSDPNDAYSPECTENCLDAEGNPRPPGSSSSGGSSGANPISGGGINGQKDGDETDVDCGGEAAPKCGEGKTCNDDDDCEVACSYAKKCIGVKSCKPHLGGDTCGEGEVEEGPPGHESCCRSLKVAGFSDDLHPGKEVYLDKYEITAGRVRAWIEAMTTEYGGEPNVKAWITANKPVVWDDAWNEFLPEGFEGPTKVIARRLLGDPRPEDNGWPVGPGVIVPPPTDEARNLGVNYQFNSEIYVDLHGLNCGTWEGTYGFPTFYYPPDILARNAQLARADGQGLNGATIPAKEFLDTKAMNCIPNAMLAAFCAWDGGQLATDEVLDYVTKSPASYGFAVSGCGTQYDNHGDLLKEPPDFSRTVQTGGTCANVGLINATFDAGDALPKTPGHTLNEHNYWYPFLIGAATHDKSSEIAAPGRASTAAGANGKAIDAIALAAGDEPWMDLAGNLSEAALDTNNGKFHGSFSLKLRGIGYGSSRSDLNVKEVLGENMRRVQRPEAKAAYIGGRCMRFK
jgi:hypothetical protein